MKSDGKEEKVKRENGRVRRNIRINNEEKDWSKQYRVINTVEYEL